LYDNVNYRTRVRQIALKYKQLKQFALKKKKIIINVMPPVGYSKVIGILFFEQKENYGKKKKNNK